jgi:hypothetical protein
MMNREEVVPWSMAHVKVPRFLSTGFGDPDLSVCVAFALTGAGADVDVDVVAGAAFASDETLRKKVCRLEGMAELLDLEEPIRLV